MKMELLRRLFKSTILLQLALSPSAAEQTIQLEGIAIFGNQELPKSLVIVPWKAAERTYLIGQPFHSLDDDLLSPIDRDVYKRELHYYKQVSETE